MVSINAVLSLPKEMFHWPQQVTWTSPASTNEEIDSTIYLLGVAGKSHHQITYV